MCECVCVCWYTNAYAHEIMHISRAVHAHACKCTKTRTSPAYARAKTRSHVRLFAQVHRHGAVGVRCAAGLRGGLGAHLAVHEHTRYCGGACGQLHLAARRRFLRVEQRQNDPAGTATIHTYHACIRTGCSHSAPFSRWHDEDNAAAHACV
jgi:hypothetical protein